MHQLSISARRIWSDSICGGFGHKTATGHSSFEIISKRKKFMGYSVQAFQPSTV